jgi:Na+/H+-dicarboxylate symporter
MAVGVALGHFYPDAGVRVEPLGDALIRVLIADHLLQGRAWHFLADMAKVDRVALKALIYFEALTTIALVIGLRAVNLFAPGAGMNIDLSHIDTACVAPYLGQTPDRTTTQFLLNIIPNTFVGAFSEGNVLQVLHVSLLCGFCAEGGGGSLRGQQQHRQQLHLLRDFGTATRMSFFRIVAVAGADPDKSHRRWRGHSGGRQMEGALDEGGWRRCSRA